MHRHNSRLRLQAMLGGDSRYLRYTNHWDGLGGGVQLRPSSDVCDFTIFYIPTICDLEVLELTYRNNEILQPQCVVPRCIR
jgi:hypothetical protein